MKAKTKKTFDAVQMVREIRDAYYLKHTEKDFDAKVFEQIKKKWEKKIKTTHNVV